VEKTVLPVATSLPDAATLEASCAARVQRQTFEALNQLLKQRRSLKSLGVPLADGLCCLDVGVAEGCFGSGLYLSQLNRFLWGGAADEELQRAFQSVLGRAAPLRTLEVKGGAFTPLCTGTHRLLDKLPSTETLCPGGALDTRHLAPTAAKSLRSCELAGLHRWPLVDFCGGLALAQGSLSTFRAVDRSGRGCHVWSFSVRRVLEDHQGLGTLESRSEHLV